jgi:hypothetical protein
MERVAAEAIEMVVAAEELGAVAALSIKNHEVVGASNTGGGGAPRGRSQAGAGGVEEGRDEDCGLCLPPRHGGSEGTQGEVDDLGLSASPGSSGSMPDVGTLGDLRELVREFTVSETARPALLSAAVTGGGDIRIALNQELCDNRGVIPVLAASVTV